MGPGGSTSRAVTVSVANALPSDTLFRVNAGGEALIATDGGPDWAADSTNNPYAGRNAGSGTVTGRNPVALDASVPSSTPIEVFQSERWDAGPAPEMHWMFPIPAGTEVEVRLYFANGWSGTRLPGQRVFGVAIDGVRVLDGLDLSAEVGHQVGVMKSFSVRSDGVIDIEFLHQIENPLINAIEIVRTKTGAGTEQGSEPAKPTVGLAASASTVNPSASVALTWVSTDADTCHASGGWSGPKATSGSEIVGPLTASTTFVLTCTGAGGIATASTAVSVQSPVLPVLSLSADPLTAQSGSLSTLVWSSTGAAACSASEAWSGEKATSGSQQVGPLTQTSTFTLTCTGAGGSANRSVTVTVAPAPLPTVSLSANPSTVNAGGTSQLSWSSTNATSCSASGAWSGSKSTSGSQNVGPINQHSTFTLTCTGPGGSASRPVTVTVQSVTGSADLSWVAPTTNEDGSPVVLSGFKVYRGSSPSNLAQIASLGATVTVYTANNLSAGTHYFAVTAVSNTGAESTFSNIESKTIP